MASTIYTANTLIIRALDEEAPIKHIKLQKLLYILYACYLAEAGTPLFSDRFVAWQYGPVLAQIYDALKEYKAEKISLPIKSPDGKYRYYSKSAKNDVIFERNLDYVWKNFGALSASQLVSLTHQPDSAWSISSDNGTQLGGFLVDENIKNDGAQYARQFRA